MRRSSYIDAHEINRADVKVMPTVGFNCDGTSEMNIPGVSCILAKLTSPLDANVQLSLPPTAGATRMSMTCLAKRDRSGEGTLEAGKTTVKAKEGDDYEITNDAVQRGKSSSPQSCPPLRLEQRDISGKKRLEQPSYDREGDNT
ncbi:hypothetical protein ACLOJK_030462 [Asimina triloba]